MTRAEAAEAARNEAWTQLAEARRERDDAKARADELEKALDDLVMACELPGDHCELQPSLDRARAALARKEKDQ